jgi:hypothetical protein
MGWDGVEGKLICDVKGGTQVLLTPQGSVVKFGVGPGEAANQKYAYELLDPKIVRVPKVYSFTLDQNDSKGPREG